MDANTQSEKNAGPQKPTTNQDKIFDMEHQSGTCRWEIGVFYPSCQQYNFLKLDQRTLFALPGALFIYFYRLYGGATTFPVAIVQSCCSERLK